MRVCVRATHLPTHEAAALASAPSYSADTPRAATLSARSAPAAGPATWRAVFSVSSGVSSSRHAAPPADATAVASGIGTLGASSANSASTPVLAAVSPKRDNGAYDAGQRGELVQYTFACAMRRVCAFSLVPARLR